MSDLQTRVNRLSPRQRALLAQRLERHSPAANSQQLVAYVVTRQPLAPGELRDFLRHKLPEYMVPSVFVPLASLPLAPNGKVDYQALPVVETLPSQSDTAYVAPATEVERTIAGVWQEVLQVEQVGLHDNFFDLRGHSLAMVQVHSRLQNLYPGALTLVDMFRYPTISALVAYLSQQAPAPGAAGPGEERAAMRRNAVSRQQQRRQAVQRMHNDDEP